MKTSLILRNVEDFMRKDLGDAKADGIVFPEFALDKLREGGSSSKVPNQVFVWLHLVKLNAFEVSVTIQDLGEATGLSPNTMKDILLTLHSKNIIVYKSTKETRSNAVHITHVAVKFWFLNKEEA